MAACGGSTRPGPHSDIVISTRMRLARNVSGYAFTGRARDGERLRMLAQVRDALMPGCRR
jgi:protein arginine kinase